MVEVVKLVEVRMEAKMEVRIEMKMEVRMEGNEKCSLH